HYRPGDPRSPAIDTQHALDGSNRRPRDATRISRLWPKGSSVKYPRSHNDRGSSIVCLRPERTRAWKLTRPKPTYGLAMSCGLENARLLCHHAYPLPFSVANLYGPSS